jgi:hypothetical protein
MGNTAPRFDVGTARRSDARAAPRGTTTQGLDHASSVVCLRVPPLGQRPSAIKFDEIHWGSKTGRRFILWRASCHGLAISPRNSNLEREILHLSADGALLVRGPRALHRNETNERRVRHSRGACAPRGRSSRTVVVGRELPASRSALLATKRIESQPREQALGPAAGRSTERTFSASRASSSVSLRRHGKASSRCVSPPADPAATA